MINILTKICALLEAIYQILLNGLEVQHDQPVVSNNSSERIPNIKDDKQLFINDVCDILKVRRSTYYRYVDDGLLTPRYVGSRPFYYLKDLEEMIKESSRKGRI